MRMRPAPSVPARRAGSTPRLASTPERSAARSRNAVLRRAPVCCDTRTEAMVMAGSAPPRSVTSPGALSATIMAMAPAACRFFALSTKAQLPRSTSATFPRTAAWLAASSAVHARPVPSAWSTTGINSPVTATAPRRAPKPASPTAKAPAALPALGPAISSCDMGESVCATARATPRQAGAADGGGAAFGVRHLGPGLVDPVVQQVVVPHGRLAVDLLARLVAGKGLEAQAVRHLVQQHGDQVDAAARLAVDAQIKTVLGHAVVEQAETGVEAGHDVGRVRRGLVDPRQLAGQGGRIPGVGPGRVGKIGIDVAGAGRPQGGGGGRAAQGHEGGGHPDRHTGIEGRAPHRGGILKGDQALLAQGGAAVAAHGRGRSGIVEADPRLVVVDDGDGGGVSGAAHGKQRGDYETVSAHGRPPHWWQLRRRARIPWWCGRPRRGAGWRAPGPLRPGGLRAGRPRAA